jgi:hypothetical protein
MTSTGHPGRAATYAGKPTAPGGGVSRDTSRLVPWNRQPRGCHATPGTQARGVRDSKVATRLEVIEHDIRENTRWSTTTHGPGLGVIEPGHLSDVAVLNRHYFSAPEVQNSLHCRGPKTSPATVKE